MSIKQSAKPAAAAASDAAPASRREAGKAERRARITQAARDLLRETGAVDLSMRALAERAGVSQATPYNLFGSKRAILVSVLEDIRGFGRFFATSSRLAPFERILNAVALAVSYYEKDPEFYRVLWKTILGSDASEDRSAIFNPKRDAFWTQLLQDAADAGQLRPGIGLTGLRRALDASFRGTMLDWISGELPTRDLQRAIGFAYVLTLRGAASAPGLLLLEAPLLRFQPAPEAASA
jgi:AcrR family transcriptional regulator